MHLIEKYNRPVPRYTSYPTVPYWQPAPPPEPEWLAAVDRRLATSRAISLYVHLPFCERLCTYCGCNKRITRNHGVEQPYVDAVLAELAIYVRRLGTRPQLRELHLGGGTPTFFSAGELGRLVDGILEQVDIADTYSFGFEAHPNSTGENQLAVLAARGFHRISVGVQDFNPTILSLINRRQTESDVLRTVGEARAAGFTSLNFDLIYGLPRQRTDDIVRSVEWVKRLRPDRIAFYGYAHVPWHSPGQRAYSEADLPVGAAKQALHATGRRLLEAAGYTDIGLDHFALPDDELARAHAGGTLHRNFMGYTTANTPVTLALGCSGISDSWDTYVQNEKGVEAYQRAVLLEDRLPISRGHRLTEADQLVRRHILNLMCRGFTEWGGGAQRCPAIDRAILHWNAMALDGLVRRAPYRVEVTEAGAPFLRNVCLPLDDYYWQRQPDGQVFSQAI
ncbi:oxygen-independent coproporphyrinogen III oxidase [Lewinella sp. IMCC34183]|uniref:oxygen-independent coproporphyrinogen III oxidase n=1 Tax=Lewinella sp. IMCC34183 TaxID=2248762 RepID=UPI000E282ACC|nr:oxygen-independent coproporphyrinogen III oxidase [Lewinella sp. IMCC34183]